MWNLPSNYSEWIDRVSSIVDFVFPFSVEDDQRFTERLWWKSINKDEYMNTAKDWWTEVHRCLEEYILGHKFELSIKALEIEVSNWLKYIDQLKEKHKWAQIYTEYYIKDDRGLYQGTSDVVVIDWNKVYIYDWKTYWVAKKRYNLPNVVKINKNWTPAKPSSKIAKVSLQLSLYAEYFKRLWYEIWWLYLVHLHTDWAFEFSCPLYSSEELEEILTKFIASSLKKLLPNNIKMDIRSPLVISIQTAPIAYSAVKVELDLSKLVWTDIKPADALNELVEVQKKLHNNYLVKETDE